MCIISNGAVIPETEDVLLKKWKVNSVTGMQSVEKPEYCVFNNTQHALEILKHHIERNSNIVFHADVDVDGIGTTYIFKKTLEYLGSNRHLLVINKDKVHGIQQKHVDYFRDKPVDLVIITDSSSNEIEIIKQFNCDVICIDHHELLHNDLCGTCNDGVHKYVIVNNTISNYEFNENKLWLTKIKPDTFENIKEYVGTQDMSCGLVVYELLRLYCRCFGDENLLENLMLYQWVGVTLFTDVINTLNDRNQWYINKTVFNNDIEKSLGTMMHKITRYKATLDKSYINYSFAPLINKAIRAGKSSEALDIVINHPEDICNLNAYRQMQQDAVDKACYVKVVNPVTKVETKNPLTFTSPVIELNIGNLGINKNYSGVIASRLSGDNSKNAAVYIINEKGLCKGSFRGLHPTVDYRKYFADYSDDVYAQGHPSAFGFELKKEQLDDIMGHIKEIEPQQEDRPFFSIGNIRSDKMGIYHITDFDKFKKLGYIWKMATGNSKVTSTDEVTIRVSASDVSLESTSGKLFIYKVLGMECRAFKALAGEYFDIYIEYTNEITMYIK